MKNPNEIDEVTAKAAHLARQEIDDTDYMVGQSDQVKAHDEMVAGLSPAEGERYDRLALEHAAGGPDTAKHPPQDQTVSQEVRQQIAVDSAGRLSREQAGLPSRPLDLK